MINEARGNILINKAKRLSGMIQKLINARKGDAS
jgi:hypothetical protein